MVLWGGIFVDLPQLMHPDIDEIWQWVILQYCKESWQILAMPDLHFRIWSEVQGWGGFFTDFGNVLLLDYCFLYMLPTLSQPVEIIKIFFSLTDMTWTLQTVYNLTSSSCNLHTYPQTQHHYFHCPILKFYRNKIESQRFNTFNFKVYTSSFNVDNDIFLILHLFVQNYLLNDD